MADGLVSGDVPMTGIVEYIARLEASQQSAQAELARLRSEIEQVAQKWRTYTESYSQWDLAADELDEVLAALARGGEPADDKCQLNRSGNWCLTHSCYPQTCSKLARGGE